MGFLISLIMTIAFIGVGNQVRAADDLLGLDVGLENFATGIFFYDVLTEFDSSVEKTKLFTDVRAQVENALQRHKIRFMSLTVDEQAVMLGKLILTAHRLKPLQFTLFHDQTRNEVYVNLLQWGKGRLAGLITQYTEIWKEELEVEKRIRVNGAHKPAFKLPIENNTSGLLVDPKWNR